MRYQAAKALDDLAENASRTADRLGGPKASNAADRILSTVLIPVRNLIPVGCTRAHGHDEHCI
jgi:hypothetical protein